MRIISIGVAILVLAFAASAQEGSSTAFHAATSFTDAPTFNGTGSLVPPGVTAPEVGQAPVPLPIVLKGFVFESPATSPEPAAPQAPVAVYETFPWQLAADYMFFRFYEVPKIQQNANGLIVTGNYYFKDWLAAEGEFMGTWGHQAGVESHLAFGGGGPRFRWSGPRNIELFGHVLVGHMHFVPQTPFGPQGAFAYILGGGVDINAHHRRYAYRVGADLVGTHFFGTEQFSPRVYAGFVFKF